MQVQVLSEAPVLGKESVIHQVVHRMYYGSMYKLQKEHGQIILEIIRYRTCLNFFTEDNYV